MSSLEERVAALEDLAARPLVSVSEDEQARFQAAVDAAIARGGWNCEVLPAAPGLTPDEVRSLLRECVTVVKPGETLVIRGDRNWTPNQMREVQDMLDAVTEWRDLGINFLVVPGEELGVAEAAGG